MSAALQPVARLKVDRVSREFPGVKALDDVSVEVAPGEVHALVGENGAGKSTLMNLIAGVYVPDSGRIYLDGKDSSIRSERDANEWGVAMVHQEQSLVGRLTIAENIWGARPPVTRYGVIDTRAMHREAHGTLERLGIELPTSRTVSTLSPAQGQMIEIAKAVIRPLRLLILDEPTASLSPGESAHLFRVVRQLSADGVAVLYVSHRLAEVFELSSRVTILKDGQVTGVRDTADTNVDELIQLMVGRELAQERDPRRAPRDAPVVLQVENIVAPPVKGASFEVRAGEIVCLAGLVGAGRTELCEAVFGARAIRSGRVILDGKPLRLRHPGDAVNAGIGMVPEDRKGSGLFLEMNLTQNVGASSLPRFSRLGLVSWKELRRVAASFVNRLSIKTTDVDRPVKFLSGGNQQKVLLARWLVERPRLLIVDEPTRGVDVGAKAEIYRILRDLAADGTALLVVSSDMLEVLAIAHRIVVLREGRIAGELTAEEADEVAVLRLASPTREEAREEGFA